MVYVSVRGRIWLQVEAANMVESIGNYVKHRRVPVLIKDSNNRYMTFLVPSISGESIAHTYQVLLANELKRNNSKVCKYCEKGIFLKNTNANVFKDVTGKNPPSAKNIDAAIDAAGEIEKSIIENCGVEDIGGFLYAENPNVKRTSSFQTGYMIPVREVLSLVTIEPQLHSRYALGTKFVSLSSGASGQMIYYVEVSSALFTFAFDLDTKYIGKYTYHLEKYGQKIIEEKEIRTRKISALEALKKLLLEFPVGAKRTRFNPSDLKWESIGIAVSSDVWTMPSSFTRDYLARAIVKKGKVSYDTTIYAYSEDECKADKCYDTPEDAVLSSLEDAQARINNEE